VGRPSKLTAERQAWERREGETAKAFGMFTAYLNMKPAERSYRNLAKMYNKNGTYVTQISRWASKWEWQARLLAWTEWQAANTRSGYDIAREEVQKTTQNLTRIMLSFAGKASRQMSDGIIDISELDVLSRAMMRILDQARQEFDYLPIQRSKVETWQDQAIADIREGKIEYKDLADAFDTDLATQLFTRAGVPVSNTTD